MKITGGRYRGRNILCPKGEIRPAMGKMRESMFSILGTMEGFSFLDLFSGSGLVGIEAASRGAEPVVLVEKDFGKKQTIERNISFVESKIELVMMPVLRYISRCNREFGIIYLDPPFIMEKKQELVALIGKRKLLHGAGVLLIHHPVNENWNDKIGDLDLDDIRVYGHSILRFYRYA